MIIVGAGIVGASFAYHAYQNGVDKITVLSSHLPGDKNQATSNTWGWVNGYASNDESYAKFRMANLNYIIRGRNTRPLFFFIIFTQETLNHNIKSVLQ